MSRPPDDMPEEFGQLQPLAVLRMWAFLRFHAGQWSTKEDIAAGTGLSFDVVRNNIGRLRELPRIQVEQEHRSGNPGRPTISRIRFQPIHRIIFGED